MKRLILVLCLASTVACATSNVQGRSTANLTSPGLVALHASEVVRVLDVIRDTAVDAETAKLLSTDTTRKVVTWHKAALQTIQATPGGWKLTVLAGLDALYQPLTPSEQSVLRPYIFAAKLVIESVQ